MNIKLERIPPNPFQPVAQTDETNRARGDAKFLRIYFAFPKTLPDTTTDEQAAASHEEIFLMLSFPLSFINSKRQSRTAVFGL